MQQFLSLPSLFKTEFKVWQFDLAFPDSQNFATPCQNVHSTRAPGTPVLRSPETVVLCRFPYGTNREKRYLVKFINLVLNLVPASNSRIKSDPA